MSYGQYVMSGEAVCYVSLTIIQCESSQYAMSVSNISLVSDTSGQHGLSLSSIPCQIGQTEISAWAECHVSLVGMSCQSVMSDWAVCFVSLTII